MRKHFLLTAHTEGTTLVLSGTSEHGTICLWLFSMCPFTSFMTVSTKCAASSCLRALCRYIMSPIISAWKAMGCLISPACPIQNHVWGCNNCQGRLWDPLFSDLCELIKPRQSFMRTPVDRFLHYAWHLALSSSETMSEYLDEWRLRIFFKDRYCALICLVSLLSCLSWDHIVLFIRVENCFLFRRAMTCSAIISAVSKGSSHMLPSACISFVSSYDCIMSCKTH